MYDAEDSCGPREYFGTFFEYNSAGVVWMIGQGRWDVAEPCEEEFPPCPPGEIEWLSMDEFRNVGRSMRLTRRRDPQGLIYPFPPIAGSERWSDYDGDEIYADASVEIDNGELVLTTQAAHEPGIGTAIPNGDRLYRHGDQIGTTREVTADGAYSLAQAVYTAFGERVYADDPSELLGRYQYAGAHGYQSDMYENEGGGLPFIHVGHRWYDPATGRFVQRDPNGILGGFNVYVYGWSAPVVWIDPDGELPEWFHRGFIKGTNWIFGNPRGWEEELRRRDQIGITCMAVGAAATGGAAYVAAGTTATGASAARLGGKVIDVTIRYRKSPGADGAICRYVKTQENGVTKQVLQQVFKNGKLIHHHQKYPNMPPSPDVIP